MAITSYGYGGEGGSVDEVAWAKMAPHLGAQPHIVTGMAVTVTSAVDRTVAVGAGELAGYGIYDVATGASLTLASQSGTTPRWDAIVAHRDWQATPNGLTTITAVTGVVGAAPKTPPGLAVTPGVAADQIIAWIPVTSTGAGTPTAPFGPFTAGSPLYWATSTIDPVAADLPYGQLVVQFQGGQNRFLLRRGGTGDAAVFDDMFNPPWLPLTLSPGIVALTSGRAPSCRVVGGMLQLAGSAARADGSNFLVGGGNGGQYEIGRITAPSGVPTAIRRPIAPGGNARIQLAIGASADFVQAIVYDKPTSQIHFDGVQVPLTLG